MRLGERNAKRQRSSPLTGMSVTDCQCDRSRAPEAYWAYAEKRAARGILATGGQRASYALALVDGAAI